MLFIYYIKISLLIPPIDTSPLFLPNSHYIDFYDKI